MNERFIGRVVDVNDPEQAGRVKIRIYGLHDDTSRVPDDSLPWARCVFPVTNPVLNGVAGPTTGLIKDSTIVGYFADHARQVPLIDGTLGGASDKESDFPMADRGEDINAVLGKHLPSVGASDLKGALEKSIGSIKFSGQKLDSLLKEANGSSIVDLLSSVKSALKTFSDLKNAISSLTSPSDINSVIQGFAGDLNSIADDLESEVLKFTNIGTLVKKVEDVNGIVEIISTLGALEGDVAGLVNLPSIPNTVNHLVGSITNRTSKTSINSIEDAVKRVSGSRFVMNNIMPYLDSTLNSLLNMKKTDNG